MIKCHQIRFKEHISLHILTENRFGNAQELKNYPLRKDSSNLSGVPKLKPIVRPLLAWFQNNARDMPWRRTTDPYAIWISEIMLQQTQVKKVIPYWNRWITRLPDVASLAKARTETVLKLWAGLGYYNRAQNLRRAAQVILRDHDGLFPTTFEEVFKLPGVGKYTAGAICSIAFNQPVPAVDGNVVRVLSRFLGIKANPTEAATKAGLWKTAQDLVSLASEINTPDTQYCSQINQGLMELGATVCTPRNPKCKACPFSRTCIANLEKCTGEIPALASPPISRHRRFVAFAVSHKGLFLVQKRSANGINAQLWEFLNSEVSTSTIDIDEEARACLGFSPGKLHNLGTVHHTITRNRIRLDVYYTEVSNRRFRTLGTSKWCSDQQLNNLPFPSAHRKIVDLLRNFKLTLQTNAAKPVSINRSSKHLPKDSENPASTARMLE